MDTALLKNSKHLLVYFFFWFLFALAQAMIINMAGFSWQTAFTDTVVFNGLLSGLCFVIVTNMKFYRPGLHKAIGILLTSAAIITAWLIAGRLVMTELLKMPEDYLAFLDLTLPIRFIVALLGVQTHLMGAMMFYSMQDHDVRKKNEEDVKNLAKEAELNRLHMQLQPHFLFNSLNSINALVGVQPDEARRMILMLSGYLRSNINKKESDVVGLQDEIQDLELFLNIEKVRFGSRLNTTIKIDAACLDAQLPVMLLQPVVENAIKFGLYDTIDDVTISLNIFCQKPMLVFEITNPYDPNSSSHRSGTGFGLGGIKRRLYLLYGRNDLLETKGENNIFTTRIYIPMGYENSNS